MSGSVSKFPSCGSGTKGRPFESAWAYHLFNKLEAVKKAFATVLPEQLAVTLIDGNFVIYVPGGFLLRLEFCLQTAEFS
jgi:hypothetical protein